MSELHAMATKKSVEVRAVLDRYERYRKIVSENMHDYIEYLRVIEELAEVKTIIASEEDRGVLYSLHVESELKNKEKSLSDSKERVNKLNSLLMTVSCCKLQAVTHKREKHCLTIHSF